MSRDLDKLIPQFRERVDALLVECTKRGITMRPFFTERTPWEQARIYRSTRGTWEITRSANRMRANGAPYLADVLMEVGPQYSPPSARGHLTNALPGLSWHQWGEAIDCFWLLKDEAVWSVKHIIELPNGEEINGYFLYGDIAINQGLLSAGMAWGWDWPHVQFSSVSSPLDQHTWFSINDQMRTKFGTKEVS